MDTVEVQKQIKKSFESVKMHPNIEEERKRCTLNVQNLASILYSGSDSLDHFLVIQNIIQQDPLLKFQPEHIALSNKDAHALLIQRNARLSQIQKREQDNLVESYMNCIVDLPVSSSVHTSVCIPYLKLLASDEQLQTILPKAESFSIQICYCSAELALGSDLNSVQTEAHLDEINDQFIINTPSLGATKWWIGDYGQVATHAIVFAQLFVNQQKQGVAAFLIPIRNHPNQPLLPGIEIGDIERKNEQQGIQNDNGFVRFKQYRVSRDCLLQRYTTINRKGQVSLAENKKILLGNMLNKRVGHILELGLLLSQACTIAVRFSVVQDRFYNDQYGTKYIKNLDYQVIQQKILPHLSSSYMILFTFLELNNLSKKNLSLCNSGDYSSSSEIKAIVNAVKSLSSTLTYFGVENLRQSCGNVGLSHYAGFNQILSKISAFPLYEADQKSLTEYTAKYLQKKLKDRNDQSIFTRFLSNQKMDRKCNFQSEHEFEDLTNILFILEARSQYLTIQFNKNQEQNINNQQAISELSDAFTDTILLRCLIKRRQKLHEGQQEISDSFKSMGIVYALERIIKKMADYIEHEYLSVKQFKIINSIYQKHLLLIRNNAVGLVDAFSFTDNSLKSAIGVYSGYSYETLNDWVSNKNQLNSVQSQQLLTQAIIDIKPSIIKQAPKL